MLDLWGTWQIVRMNEMEGYVGCFVWQMVIDIRLKSRYYEAAVRPAMLYG